MSNNYLYQEESAAIIGAAVEMHKELKLGFAEAVYQEGLEMEFKRQNIPFASQYPLSLYYKGELMQTKYYADFLCFNKIIVEIKAVDTLLPEHEAQLLNYLRVSRLHVGLLINFKKPKIEVKRFVI